MFLLQKKHRWTNSDSKRKTCLVSLHLKKHNNYKTEIDMPSNTQQSTAALGSQLRSTGALLRAKEKHCRMLLLCQTWWVLQSSHGKRRKRGRSQVDHYLPLYLPSLKNQVRDRFQQSGKYSLLRNGSQQGLNVCFDFLTAMSWGIITFKRNLAAVLWKTLQFTCNEDATVKVSFF